ncbi:MAG: hypothetical protein JST84_05895 [Acidobacteria bacterium]|nr:hypothetical protein [Acidobacteriota bacterium]
MRKLCFVSPFAIYGLSLAMIFSGCLSPTAARPVTKTIDGAMAPGAIGIIQSSGLITINGRAAAGTFTLWGDEFVQVSAESRLIFGALGEATISPGACLQLKMQNAKLFASVGKQFFSASLLAGAMQVKLQPATSALVDTADTSLTASQGAYFNVDLKNSHTTIQANKGTILANTHSTRTKPNAEKPVLTKSLKKEAAALTAKKLENLIGNYPVQVPDTILAEASRREQALADLQKRRTTFMSSLTMNTTATFFAAEQKQRNLLLVHNIGAAESLRGVLINGHLSSGREMLWGGEVLEAPPGSGAHLSFSAIGQVVLPSGARAKLTTETVGVTAGAAAATRVLAAQLLSGNLHVKFDPQASGYVRAGDSVIAASRGANFRVEMRDGDGAVEVNQGSVMVIGNWPLLAPPLALNERTGKALLDEHRYQIRPVTLHSSFAVAPGGTKQLQMRVTNERNQAVANVPVLFALKGPGSLGATVFGMSSLEARTNAQGIAVVTYNAAASVSTATVTAAIPGSSATTTTTANVTAQRPPFASWQGGLPAVIVGAAAVGIGVGVWATRRDKLPIKGSGDTIIIP